jgi:spore maturation protein CgeB
VPTVLIVGGTQVTTSDLHLLYHRAFQRIGWRSLFMSNDSHLPFGERILQQSQLRFSRVHFALFNHRARRLARQARPDLVFITGSNWYLMPETVRWLRRRLGCKVVLNEQHLQVFRPYQAEALSHYDHVFVQDSGLAALLQAASPARRVSLLGPACDPQEHRPLTLDPEDRERLGSDVCYLGYAYPNRLQLFEQLLDFSIRLWGVGWDASPVLKPRFNPEPIHGLKKTKVYNATAVNVNLQSVSYQIDGVTCRPFEIAACGCFCLSEPKKDLALFFAPGEEIVTFEGVRDLRQKAAYYLAHEDERREIAQLARARALREHTYEHRARQVAAAVGLG